MAPVGIYSTGAIALYGGAVLRRGEQDCLLLAA